MPGKFKKIHGWILLLLSVLFGLALAECILRLTAFRATYGEQNVGAYISPFPEFNKRHLLYPESSDSLLSVCSEFKNWRKSNRLGLITDEFDFKKDSGLIRIITFGDSNTEGIGAAYDSSWPAQLRNYAQQVYPDRKFEVINAGVAGSDMVFSLDLLEQKLIAASPDLVILETNPTDLNDLAIRGGFERFQKDKIQLRRKAPHYEFLYAHSRVFRALFHSLYETDFYFRTEDEQEADQKYAELLIDSLLDKYATVCRKNNVIPFVLINASLNDLQMPLEERTHYMLIETLCKKKQIAQKDMYSVYASLPSSDWKNYFWSVDRHPNAAGYRLMAKTASGFLNLPIIGSKP